ncbi:MAG: hypothetical protein ORN57_02800 [Alphaproteobacteria bacterium]|nr:hypothetical protein [Alphaproteobacteria bacterium]
MKKTILLSGAMLLTGVALVHGTAAAAALDKVRGLYSTWSIGGYANLNLTRADGHILKADNGVTVSTGINVGYEFLPTFNYGNFGVEFSYNYLGGAKYVYTEANKVSNNMVVQGYHILLPSAHYTFPLPMGFDLRFGAGFGISMVPIASTVILANGKSFTSNETPVVGVFVPSLSANYHYQLLTTGIGIRYYVPMNGITLKNGAQFDLVNSGFAFDANVGVRF